MKTDILDKLHTRISENCTPVDREARFDAMLDECYSFERVGGPFEHMSPSDVLKHCDPTAYRCGVNDYADGEDWVEVDGEYYERRDAERERDDLVSELGDEASALEDEIAALEQDAEKNEDAIDTLNEQLDEMRDTIRELSRAL